MPDALTVEFKLLGIDSGIRDMQRFAQQMARMQGIMSGGGSGSSGVTNAAAVLAIQRQQLQVVSLQQQIQIRGQNQQFRAAQSNFRNLTRPQTGNIGSAIGSLISTARVGMSSGGVEFMPLVNKLSAVFGELSGPVGLAAGALNLLQQAAAQAAAEMRAFRSAQFTSGGSRYEVAYGETLGKSLGFNPETAGKDVAGQSRAFADRITSDPYAMSYANRYGVHDVPGPAGAVDKMAEFTQWLEKLRQMPEAEAIRAARATGTEDFLGVRDLNEGTFQQIKQAALDHASQFSADALRRNANNDAGDAMQNQYMHDQMNRVGNWWRNNTTGWGIPGGEGASASGSGTNHTDRQTTAAERTAAATESMNQLMRTGLTGGGERAAGAIPSAYLGGGWAIKQLNAQAHALGAFAL